MPVTKQLHLQDFVAESYEKLGAKLSSLCKESFGNDIKIKIIVAAPGLDAGRGSAILKLTRQFGIFPIELSELDGKLQLQTLSELPPFTGLTLIIQSFPIDTQELTERKNSTSLISNISDISNKTDNLEAHIPTPIGIMTESSRISINKLVQQVGTLSRYFTQSNNGIAGPIMYLSGFTFASWALHSENLPESKIMPWYLLIGDKRGVRRIYRQPELEIFLHSVPEDAPKIEDLEEYISEMDRE